MATALNQDQMEHLLSVLKSRFEKNMHRHTQLIWSDVNEKLIKNTEKLAVLWQMEETGGEPDVIDFDANLNEFVFCDCAKESPKGRRSFCYDLNALNARKEHKPADSAVEAARKMGVKLLNEVEYRKLQELEPFDTKTSSWIETPQKIRDLDGALFGDFRYNTVFIYHNGAQSYYAARGFRGLLRI